MTIQVQKRLHSRLRSYWRLLDDLLQTADELREQRERGAAEAPLDHIADLEAVIYVLELKARHLRELGEMVLEEPQADEGPASTESSHISLADAAAYADLSVSTLRNQVHAGRLKARKVGRNWLTTPRWLFEYLESRR